MSRTTSLLAVLLALTVGACAKLDTFECAGSSECVHDGLPGVCEADGLCSFPDAGCPSGKKYGEFSGPQAGQCVDLVGATSGGVSMTQASVPTSEGATDESTVTVDPSQVSTTTSPTTLTTSDPTLETTSDATTGPTCAGLGEDCGGLACCSPCMTCVAGTCQAAAPEAGPGACGGLCFTCEADGECAALPADTECTTDCNQVIWKPQVVGGKTGCYAYADLPTPSTCDAAGQCRLPFPSDCPDPTLIPMSEKLLAQCDTVCLADEGLCVPGGPAVGVTPETYCVLGAESAGCADACTLDMNMAPAEDDAACDGTGTCVHSLTSCSGGLKCNPGSQQCYSKCNKPEQCVSNMCMSMMCI